MSRSQAKIYLIILVILLIAGFGLYYYNYTKQKNIKVTDETIKIGFIGPLTGNNANIGKNTQASINLAIEEINNAGGINGKKLEVIFEDGRCNGKEAINAAQKLINIDKVPVIIGGLCSAETLAVSPLAETSKTVLLSPCSSAPTITNAGDYIFRNYPSDNFQGAFAADYIYNKLNFKKVAILYCLSDYCIGIQEVFKKRFEELGGQIVAIENFEDNTTDLRTQLTKIKAAKPELLYFISYSEEAIIGLKQMKELDLRIKVFGADAFENSEIWNEVGDAGEGVMYSVVYPNLNDEYKNKMRTKLNSDEITIICSPQAYDAVKILAQVISKVGVNPESIKNELYNISYTNGVSAQKIEFDKNGDLKDVNYIIKIVKNGKAVELE